MRSPPLTSTAQPLSEAAASTNQQEEGDDGAQPNDSNQLAIDKTGGEEEQQQAQAARPARFTALPPNRPTTELRMKRFGSRQQLLERTRSRIRRSMQEHEPLDSAGPAPNTNSLATGTSDFAEEIESEATEIRTLIARTAQLWSAVDRAERVEELPPLQLQRFSTSALHTALPTPFVCEDDITSSSEQEEEEEEEEEEAESVNQMPLQSTTQGGDYSTNEALARAASSTLEQTRSEDQDCNSDSDRESEDSTDGRDEIEQSGEDLQLEQGEVVDASNRAINASKARAIQNAMEGNLLRLGFRERITRAALEAGVLEIDHYDSDCELAYVDIFMSLVKMVCDAHVDVLNEGEDFGENSAASGSVGDLEQALDADATYTLERRSFLPFKWPVFDMAQFEFGNARSGTCFNSVCVLTNLPKVSMDRTEELMEILSCNLFCMIGDPIQVVIPSASSTGRTKGHAFLEFDDPEMAKRCALAVDGLTWGRGPFGRIRGNLFRQYQVKSPAEEQRQAQSVTDEGASLPRSLSSPVSVFFQDGPLAPPFERQGGRLAGQFRPELERNVVQQQDIFCDSDEDSSDTGEWVASRPLEYAQFNPSPLLDLSSGSVDIREQFEQVHPDGIPVQLGWDETLDDGYAMQMSSEGEDDDEDGSFSSSALELQSPDEEKLMDQSLLDELARTYTYNSRCSPARVSLSSREAQAASSTVTSTTSGGGRERLVDCGMTEQVWDEDGVEKPWRRYCEDLIIRNREMQEQMALARRRVVQLSHNNQKLHLLIDRVERDRDGLLFENDLLQTQLNGYEDHEMHHDSLMKELVMLRKRLNQIENPFDFRALGLQQHVEGVSNRPQAFPGSFHSVQAALSNLSSTALSSCKMDHLKDWEHLLETTLSHVRTAKEEKALEMQKKLDRQVEEQNELKLCVICLANEKTILCLPCRHLCLCQTCSCREEVTKCPICRLEIEEMLAVYS